jgi:hypothetical protein
VPAVAPCSVAHWNDEDKAVYYALDAQEIALQQKKRILMLQREVVMLQREVEDLRRCEDSSLDNGEGIAVDDQLEDTSLDLLLDQATVTDTSYPPTTKRQKLDPANKVRTTTIATSSTGGPPKPLDSATLKYIMHNNKCPMKKSQLPMRQQRRLMQWSQLRTDHLSMQCPPLALPPRKTQQANSTLIHCRN